MVLDINSVSDQEYVSLVTSVESVFNPTYDCSKCINRFKDKASLERQFKIKSCTTSGAFRFQIDNIRYNKCPGNYVSPQVSYLLSLFSAHDKHGILPDSGTLLDQTYKTWEIICIIESVVMSNRKKIQDRNAKRGR